MSVLIRKNLTKKRDLMILLVFIILAAFVFSLRYGDKIFDSEIKKIVIDGLRKIAGGVKKPF